MLELIIGIAAAVIVLVMGAGILDITEAISNQTKELRQIRDIIGYWEKE